MTQPTTPPPADEPEVVYYQGRPMFRADQVSVLLFGGVGVVLVVLGLLALVLSWGIAWWVALVLVAAGVLAVVIPVWLTRLTRYRITSHRIDFERGILTKRIDTLELWHVDDISFRQGIVDRIFNAGCIVVMSDDKTTPRLDLHGVPDPRAVFEALKNRVIAVKRQRGVIKVDAG